MHRDFSNFEYVKINITIFQNIKRRRSLKSRKNLKNRKNSKSRKNRKKRKASFTLIKKLQIVVNKHKAKKTTKKTKKQHYVDEIKKNINVFDIQNDVIRTI